MIAPLELSAAQAAELAAIEVDDRGAPITVFAFAGAMKQLGGVPIFEFRNALRQVGGDFNLVLLRDIHRSYYQLRHDGRPGGLDDYAERISALMSRLGGAHHVALGTSMGATAALYFGARCRMQHVVAFGPNWPILDEVDWRRRWNEMKNLGALVRTPRGYSESLTVMQVVALLTRRLRRKLGGAAVDPMIAAYRDGGPIPETTIYYGARCPYDVRSSQRIGGTGRVTLVPVATGMHNVAGHLKRQGLLFRTIKTEIEAGALKTLAAKSPASGGAEFVNRLVSLTAGD